MTRLRVRTFREEVMFGVTATATLLLFLDHVGVLEVNVGELNVFSPLIWSLNFQNYLNSLERKQVFFAKEGCEDEN